MIEQLFDKLPSIENGKVALLFTGGVESTLLANALFRKYGKDRVVLVLLLMKEYNVFDARPAKAQRVCDDFNKATQRVGATHTIIVDDISRYAGTLPERVMQYILNVYPDIVHTFDGYDNLHRESLEVFYNTNFSNDDKFGVKQAKVYLASYKDLYPELYEFVFTHKGLIYFVEDDYEHKTTSDVTTQQSETHTSPLLYYTKAQVIQMFAEMGIADQLTDTMSCNYVAHRTTHCGLCHNCLNRKAAFIKANVEDRTEYDNV